MLYLRYLRLARQQKNKVGLAGWWALTVISAQLRPYHAFKVIIYLEKLHFNKCKFQVE